MGKGIGRAGAAALGLQLMTVLALGLAVPGVHAQAPDRAGLPPLVELPAELDRVLRDYETAWAAGDADALAALFTEDGFALRPRRAPVMGRTALREAYAGAGGPLVLRAYAFAIGGSVAHVIGGFAPTASDREIGKFVLSLERGPSGRWLIVADIDNGN
jgi:ketosteroid isomerase-like protein